MPNGAHRYGLAGRRTQRAQLLLWNTRIDQACNERPGMLKCGNDRLYLAGPAT